MYSCGKAFTVACVSLFHDTLLNPRCMHTADTHVESTWQFSRLGCFFGMYHVCSQSYRSSVFTCVVNYSWQREFFFLCGTYYWSDILRLTPGCCGECYTRSFSKVIEWDLNGSPRVTHFFGVTHFSWANKFSQNCALETFSDRKYF